MLLLLELFSWLSIQVRPEVTSSCNAITVPLHFNCTVCSRQCCSLCQILCEAGVTVPLCHCSTAPLHYNLDAILAESDCQVWKEDGLLLQHVDSHDHEHIHVVCRLFPVHSVPAGHFWSNGCLQCLSVAMVSLCMQSPPTFMAHTPVNYLTSLHCTKGPRV